MPKLESLQVIGFKSFAEKTEVRFDTGVTAIVGPNGCGKSNIADAINWVVGEQKPRILRADRMEDIIFNGTGKRKALNFTEVTLQLKDYERVLPAHNGDPEVRQVEPVAITRRMFRSGESEYYINDKRCRLKDIYELFEGTGLGHNSYALIEQGRIDQILSSKPLERRALIEEAARVSVFKSRKRAAEIKLELAQQNLVRVNDIINEVRRQADSLKRQAAKARRYGRLREELRQVQRERFCLQFSRLNDRLARLNRELEQWRQTDRELSQENRQLEERRVELGAALEGLDRRLREVRELLSRIEMDTERSQQQTRFQARQIDEARQRGAQAQERSAALQSKLRGLEDRQLARIGELEEARRQHDSSQAQANEIRAGLESIQRQIENTHREIEQHRQRAITHADQTSRLRNEAARLGENRSHLARQRERLQQEQARQTAGREQLEARLQESQGELAQAEERRQLLQEHTEQLGEQLAALAASQEESAQDLTSLSEQYSMLRHRLTSLEEIERRRSNYSEGLQKFLTSAPSGAVRVAGTVADLVEARPEFEILIEDYLNEQLQYVVVDSLSEALKGVEHVKEIKAGKCTFMSLAAVNGHGYEGQAAAQIAATAGSGVLGRLAEQMSMRPELELALARVFPDFSSTYIVQDIDAAMRLSHSHPECAYLTLGGEYLTARGLLSAAGERKSVAGLLSLRREKRELEERGAGLQKRLEEARAALAMVRARSKEAQETQVRSQRELHQSELDATRLEQGVASLRQELAKIEQAERVARLEEERMAAEQAELEHRWNQIEGEIRQQEGVAQSSETSLSELNERLVQQQAAKEAESSRLAEARMEMAALQERVAAADKDCQRYSQEQQDLEAQKLKAEEEAQESQATVDRLEASNRGLAEELERLQQEQGSNATVRDELERQHGQTKEAIAVLEPELAARRARREELREQISALEVERARDETELGALNRVTQEEVHTAIEELAAGFDIATLEATPEQVEERYTELRSKVENFGPINMSALEEFQAHEERLQFLLTQQADIQTSIATTQKTIEELNRHSLQQFQDAFTRINANFLEVFQVLFEGGHAEMRLLDENDPMESGIEIIASPPGKRLQNVMLLSGGEKALTALALLMGIFKFRPGPFCVLDEVDAPLDDANVRRFSNMLVQMSANTQFVVITHNKRTLEVAQYLYGVTMQEAGISRIVSVRFN